MAKGLIMQDILNLRMLSAKIDCHGTKRWYDSDGELHSENDFPAVIFSDGTRHWYHHGKLQREGKPALIGLAGFEAWYQNDKYHRTDGPALTNAYNVYWYVNGIQFQRNELIPLEVQISLLVLEI